jgi:hypothetical protein
MDESWKDHFEPLIMERMNMMDEESDLWDYIRDCDGYEDEARLEISRELFHKNPPFTNEQECLKMMDASDMIEMFQFAFERGEDYGMLTDYVSKSESFILGVFNLVWYELGYDHIQSEWGAIMEQYENCHK